MVFCACVGEHSLVFWVLSKKFKFLQLVNHVYFSPDGQWIASASFDKSVKLWNGTTGKFVAAFRGHVGPVYQIRLESAIETHSSIISTVNHYLLILVFCTAGQLTVGSY